MKKKVLSCPVMILLVFISSFFLMACNSSRGVREAANVLGAYTKKIKNESKVFSDARTLMHKARTVGINATEDNAFHLEKKTHDTVSFWAMSKEGQDQVKLYNLVKQMTQRTYQKRLEQKELEKAHQDKINTIKSGTSIKYKSLENTAKALGELGSEKKKIEKVKFYFSYLKDVYQSIQDKKEAVTQELLDADSKNKTKVSATMEN